MNNTKTTKRTPTDPWNPLSNDPVPNQIEEIKEQTRSMKAKVALFRDDLLRPRIYSDNESSRLMRLDHIRHVLRGKDLACWCELDAPCHCDVLLEIANG